MDSRWEVSRLRIIGCRFADFDGSSHFCFNYGDVVAAFSAAKPGMAVPISDSEVSMCQSIGTGGQIGSMTCLCCSGCLCDPSAGQLQLLSEPRSDSRSVDIILIINCLCAGAGPVQKQLRRSGCVQQAATDLSDGGCAPGSATEDAQEHDLHTAGSSTC